METAKPTYKEAKLFRDIVLAACPTQWLAYNQSPSSAQDRVGCVTRSTHSGVSLSISRKVTYCIDNFTNVSCFNHFLVLLHPLYFLLLLHSIVSVREKAFCARLVFSNFSWRFNWDASGMTDEEMSTFIWDLGKIGSACRSHFF